MLHRILTTSVVAVVFAWVGTAAHANHNWGDYHWARATSPFDLTIINSTTSDWDGYVTEAVTDWSGSSVLNMVEDLNGSTANRVRRQCKGGGGRVRICNLEYGFTGWLGIAGISIDTNGHITTGYTKLNDSYFNSSYYNNFDWKQSVTCQELGHNVGLDHQDVDFNNDSLFSCMDYQDPPYEYPNAHDFEQLETIYGHLDAYDSYDGASEETVDGGGGCNAPPGKGCNKSGLPESNRDIGWGVSIGRRGNSETFMQIDPDGTRHITHVLWVDEHYEQDEH
jgi:hypothetical protein